MITRASIVHTEEEDSLYMKVVIAHHNYLSQMAPRLEELYYQRMKTDAWDTTHWAYKYCFPDCPLEPQVSEEADQKKSQSEDPNDKEHKDKDLYKSLCLKYHPDRCTDDNATYIFQTIQRNWEEGTISKLQLLNETSNTVTPEMVTFLISLQELKSMEYKIWYQLFIVKSKILEDMLIPKEDAAQKLASSIEKLQEENKRLRELNETLKERL